MASLSYYNLQKAIYEKLSGNSQLMSIVSGVFDYPVQSAVFPFVSIGNASIAEIINLAGIITEYNININIFARDSGKKKVADIIEIIYGLLHHGSIFVVEKMLIMMQVQSTVIQLENDGKTYKGIVSLKILLNDD